MWYSGSLQNPRIGGEEQMEGIFQPAHLLVLFAIVVLLFAGVPFFLICRWLWRKGSRPTI